MKTSLRCVSAADILKLSTPNLENLIERVNSETRSAVFESKMHDSGLFYFHTRLKFTGGLDRPQQESFERFRFRRHLGTAKYEFMPHSYSLCQSIIMCVAVRTWKIWGRLCGGGLAA